MSGIKRERWTEQEVRDLPSGEHEYFERKSGAVLEKTDARHVLGKAVSALANSGGGHLLLGVADNGDIDGVTAMRNKTSTRDWLEQVTPRLVLHHLQDFRVHEVVPSEPSEIPPGRVLLVIDVGDSALAPHQNESDHVYYSRQGGRSEPASHFYLETLRNRLANPSLFAKLADVRVLKHGAADGGTFVLMLLSFHVENIGQVAAYKWHLRLEGTDGDAAEREHSYRFGNHAFPAGFHYDPGGVSLDDTILPSVVRLAERPFGVQLNASPDDPLAKSWEFGDLLRPDLHLRYRVITETSRGQTQRTSLQSLPGFPEMMRTIG